MSHAKGAAVTVLPGLVAQQVDELASVAGSSTEQAVAAVVALVSRTRRLDTALVCDGEVVPLDRAVLGADVDTAVVEAVGPWLPGMVREGLTARSRRQREGIHHTDPAVARAVGSLALVGHDPATVTVGDPSVGGGAFLLAMAELLVPHAPVRDVVARLHGIDIDPLAVAVSGAALELWAAEPVDTSRLRVADFLTDGSFAGGSERLVDIVVGNPPFLGQLRARTARSGEQTRAVRRRWPGVGGYVDGSALFLLAGLDAVGSGGTVALMQPTSMLSARDASPVRRWILEEAAVSGFWFDGARAFEADVDTCAVVVRKGGSAGPVGRTVGPGAEAAADHPPVRSGDSWAGLMADLIGVPQVERPTDAVLLGEVAVCTAGFRDEYYGLRAAVHDDPTGALRLVTSGLIDPMSCAWGRRPCRYDRRQWAVPTVDLERVAPEVARWVRRRLRPKLVVASQTPTLEVAVDVEGCWVPCTPVISVEPTADIPSLWHIAAALSSPQASAWLAATASGSALSRRALRVSAPRVAALPLPPVGARWDRAAEAARAAHESPTTGRLSDLVAAAGEAYGELDDALIAWFLGRLLPRPDVVAAADPA